MCELNSTKDTQQAASN